MNLDKVDLKSIRELYLDKIVSFIKKNGFYRASKITGVNPGTLHKIVNKPEMFKIEKLDFYYNLIK